MPKRVKYRKVSKGSRAGYATSGTELAYGEFGLKALTRGLLTATQIEACRVAINREMKRKGKLWIRVFPDKPVTRKPIEVRMGGGKGNPEFWAAVILPGKVLFEVGGVSEEVAKECLRLAATKIGIQRSARASSSRSLARRPSKYGFRTAKSTPCTARSSRATRTTMCMTRPTTQRSATPSQSWKRVRSAQRSAGAS